MADLRWEKIKQTGGTITDYAPLERAKVPGGWLVRTALYDGGGLTFVPDPDYFWK